MRVLAVGPVCCSEVSRWALTGPRSTARWPARVHLQHRRLCQRQAPRLLPRISAAPPETADGKSSLAESEGASADLGVIWGRLLKLAMPYWLEDDSNKSAKVKLAGVVALTLGTTGVSVMFNFLGRDFFNALAEKDADRFAGMIVKWLCALCVGIPVFVFRDYYQSKLALEWREWLTRRLTDDYFRDRSFYQIQAGTLVDNPDQRISSDIRQFTETALGLSMTLLNAGIDLISFSGILYSIYPPLFAALLVYSIGGTGASLYLGRSLVGLNFQQEAQEANFRYGLVRVRENAESIAFYGGEASEERLLFERLAAAVANYGRLLIASRNLQFFTSFYRFLIQILPAAVVAPLFFRGEIEFGVINQSSSAFNHILTDVSLVVYQLESLASFSAVIDRLGEFEEVIQAPPREKAATAAESADAMPAAGGNGAGPEPAVQADTIELLDVDPGARPAGHGPLLELEGVTLRTPNGAATLVEHLDVAVSPGESLLIAGASGAGKTSTLRAIAGLWSSGSGVIRRHGRPVSAGSGGSGDIFFVPQRPYVVLGSLRDNMLYPTWADPGSDTGGTGGDSHQPPPGSNAASGDARPSQHAAAQAVGSTNGATGSANGSTPSPSAGARPPPPDSELEAVLRAVRLEGLLQREAGGQTGLDCRADWASILSLGEQQRLAFTRVLLSKPKLVLMDESTSALDTANERLLYRALRDAGITFVSVGHRPTLVEYHEQVLRLYPAQSGSRERPTWELKPTAALDPAEIA